MSLTSIRNLAFSLAFGLGCGLVFCALTLSGGHAPWPIPLPLGVLILGFSAFLFAWGRRVKAMREKDQPERKDQRRTRRRISPLQAAHALTRHTTARMRSKTRWTIFCPCPA